MNLSISEPKKKRKTKSGPAYPFPIVFDGTNEWKIYTAYLNDTGTCIVDEDEMKNVHLMGQFGKGSLSRGFPKFGKCRYKAPPIVRNRQWLRRKEWLQEVKILSKESMKEKEPKPTLPTSTESNETEDEDIQIIGNQEPVLESQLLVLPDSDPEDDNYLNDIKPSVESESFPIQETLRLTWEETFFLMFALGCLKVMNYDGSSLNVNKVWEHCCRQNKHFVERYVVYHYFRSKGWVVKPGLKYGGEFLLYKQGPQFYHASYIVIIEVVDSDTLSRDSTRVTRSMTWNNLYALNRLSETTAKEILFAQVMWPSSVPRTSPQPNPEILSEFMVKEVLWRRWNPNDSRDIICLDEEEDEDSC